MFYRSDEKDKETTKKEKKKKNNFQVQCEYDDQSGKMQITVETKKSIYKCSLDQNDLPKDIKMQLDSLENVFYCFSEDDSHDFDQEKQQLLLKTVTQIRNKSINKVTSLKMQKFEKKQQEKGQNKQDQKLKIQLVELQERVHKLEEENQKKSVIIQKQGNITNTLLEKITVLEKKYEEYQINFESERKQKLLLGNKIEILEQKLSNFAEEKQENFTKIPFLLNREAPNANKFFIINEGERTITLNNRDEQNTQILSKSLLVKGHTYRFEIKILKTKQSYIGIGVVDISKQFSQKHSSYSGNAICYWGVTGRVRYGPGDKRIQYGHKFKQNDTITTEISLDKNLIVWSVNGFRKIEISPGILAQPNRKLVPYVEMADYGDIVQWIQ